MKIDTNLLKESVRGMIDNKLKKDKFIKKGMTYFVSNNTLKVVDNKNIGFELWIWINHRNNSDSKTNIEFLLGKGSDYSDSFLMSLDTKNLLEEIDNHIDLIPSMGVNND